MNENLGEWIKAEGNYITPGGDPLWECSNCGKGRHVYGVEKNWEESKPYCPDCKMRNLYPWQHISAIKYYSL